MTDGHFRGDNVLDETIKYGLLVALAIALLIAAFTDLKSRRIANWLNGAIALGAPLFWWASDMALWPDIALQVGVALATGLLFLVVHRSTRGVVEGLPEGSARMLRVGFGSFVVPGAG